MKRTTILIGAGAALPWGAPKTEDLTNLLLNDSKAVTKSGKPFGLFLKEVLENYYGKNNKEINFESLLNAVEILYEFYNNKNIPNPIRFHPLWTSLVDISGRIKSEFPEYKTISTGSIYSFKLSNVVFRNCFLENPTGLISNEIIEGYYFYLLYTRYIGIVAEKIKEYELNCSSKEHECYNTRLKGFLNSLIKDEFILRVYSLNYDSLISTLCDDIKFFQGFTERASNENEIFYPGV